MNTDHIAAEAYAKIDDIYCCGDGSNTQSTVLPIIKSAIEKATEGWRRYALRVEGACKTGSATVEKMLQHQLGLCERDNYHLRQQVEAQSRAAHASEPWTPKFAGGDAWRIEGSPCSYGYSKQQAEEICNAHNVAMRNARRGESQTKEKE